MLSLGIVREVGRLLQEGALSQRAIARQMKVSRGVVHAIAAGRRGLFGRETPSPQALDGCESGPPARCPGCGGLVYLPCRLCQVRAYRLRLALKQQMNSAPPPPRKAA